MGGGNPDAIRNQSVSIKPWWPRKKRRLPSVISWGEVCQDAEDSLGDLVESGKDIEKSKKGKVTQLKNVSDRR